MLIPTLGHEPVEFAPLAATNPEGFLPAPPIRSAKVAFVYLLRCADGSLYCGWTKDVERRVAAHNTGRASRYTARRLPVELAAHWELDSERAARSLEWRIKQLSRSEKLELLAGGPLPV
jgi:putative endonuclease